MKHTKKILIVILLLAVFLRLYFINTISPYADEVMYSVVAEDFIEGKEGLTFMAQPPAMTVLTIIGMKLGLERVMSSRIISVIFGSLTILLVYLISKMIYNKKVALISAFSVAILSFHILYSRIGAIDSLMIFYILLVYLVYLKADKSDSLKWFFSCGMIMGLGMFVKYPIAGTFAVIFILQFFKKPSFKDLFRKQNLMILIGFLLAFTPFIITQFTGENSFLFQVHDRFEMGAPIETHTSLFNSVKVVLGFLSGVFLFVQKYPAGLLDYILLALPLIPLLFFFARNAYFFDRKKESNIFLLNFLVYAGFFVLFPIKFQYYLLPVVIMFVPPLVNLSFIYLKGIKRKPLFKKLLYSTYVIILLFILSSNIYTVLNIGSYRGEAYPWLEALSDINDYSKGENIQVAITGHHEPLLSYLVKKSNYDNIKLQSITGAMPFGHNYKTDVDYFYLYQPENRVFMIKKNFIDYYFNSTELMKLESTYTSESEYGIGSFGMKVFYK